MSDLFIGSNIDLAIECAFIVYMQNVIKKAERRLTRPLTINVDNEYKDKYDRLSVERKVRVSEHLRRVIYPEIDRLWVIETGPPDAA